MEATPVDDMLSTGGFIRQDGRTAHDVYLVRIKTPAESTNPRDLVGIVKTVSGPHGPRR